MKCTASQTAGASEQSCWVGMRILLCGGPAEKGVILGRGTWGGGQMAILSNTVRKGFTDKVTFEQKLEGDQRNSLGDIWEKNIPFK